MITRCYLEITNVCNLSCVFCPKNARPPRRMTMAEYDTLTDKLRGQIQFLYFHLMGEPMLHPLLPDFIRMARQKGFVPVLTTNGTLCARGLTVLPHKVQISLHSQEANVHAAALTTAQTEGDNTALTKEKTEGEATALTPAQTTEKAYIDSVMRFSIEAAERGTIVVLRLWNQGGFDERNDSLLDLIAQHIPRPQWTQRYDGWKLGERIYIEYDQMFEWPDDQREAFDVDEVFCYALRNQIGVLVDGTVVPCCLDHEGSIRLGNLHEQDLADILDAPLARELYEGFSHHQATQPLCQRCEYAAVTKRFRRPR